MRRAEREFPQIGRRPALGLPVKTSVFRDPELNLLDPRLGLSPDVKGDPEGSLLLINQRHLAALSRGGLLSGRRRPHDGWCQNSERAKSQGQNPSAPPPSTPTRFPSCWHQETSTLPGSEPGPITHDASGVHASRNRHPSEMPRSWARLAASDELIDPGRVRLETIPPKISFMRVLRATCNMMGNLRKLR